MIYMNMNQFKSFFDDEIIKKPNLLEMAYKTIPKDGKDWLAIMPPSLKNIICLASNPGPNPDIASIAKAYHWIMNWGLLEASQNRKEFVKKYVKPQIPDIKEVDVFSSHYRKLHLDVKKWNELDKIWMQEYEPKIIDLGDRVIDIRAANQEIAKKLHRSNKRDSIKLPKKTIISDPIEEHEKLHQKFTYGGVNGLMAHLEKAPWEPINGPNARIATSKLQGPDLSNARVESDVTGDFVRFYGLKTPNNMKIYTREVFEALRNTKLKRRTDKKYKSVGWARKLGLDSTTAKVVPEQGQFLQEDYDEALKYFVKGLDHIENRGQIGFSPEEKEWIISYVKGQYDGNWDSWSKSDVKPQLKSVTELKLRGQFDIPGLKGNERRNVKIANVINKGFKNESGDENAEYQLPINLLGRLDYSKFSKRPKYEPVNTPTSLDKIHEEYVKNNNWRWKSSGKNLPEGGNSLQLVQGNVKLNVSKDKNGLYQIFKTDENSYEPCGKNGCKRVVMTGDLKLTTNSQEVRGATPLEDDKKTEELLGRMLRNPEQFGDVKINDTLQLGSIKKASKKAGAKIDAYGSMKKIKDFDEGDFLNWGTVWLRDHMGNAKFLYGDHPQNIISKHGGDKESLRKFNKTLINGEELQSENGKLYTYMPPDILEDLLKNGCFWRTQEMSNFFRSNLATLAKKEKGYGTFGDMAGGEDGDQEYDAGDNEIHKLSDMAQLAKGSGTQKRGRYYDPTIGGMVGIRAATKINAPDIKTLTSISDKRISSLGSILSPEELEKFNFEYQKGHSQADQLGGRSWAEIVQLTATYIENSKSRYEKLGLADCIYDKLHDLFRNALSNSEQHGEILTSLSKISNDDLRLIYNAEKNANTQLYTDELYNLLRQIKTITTAQPAVPMPQKMPQITKTPMPQITPQMQHYSTADDQQESNMIDFAKWRIIKETEAIYDGTKPKNGCGFNWWGAAGKQGGVSIKGEVKKGKK